MKTPILIAAALVLLAAPALADRDGGHRSRFQPSAPLPVAEAVGAGGGTVAGTVTRAGATWLTVSDASGSIDVQARGFLPEGVKAGDPITVTGGVRRGTLSADHLVLADGTAFGTTGRDRRRGHDEDGD